MRVKSAFDFVGIRVLESFFIVGKFGDDGCGGMWCCGVWVCVGLKKGCGHTSQVWVAGK